MYESRELTFQVPLTIESPLVSVERRLREAHGAHGASHASGMKHIPIHAELFKGAVNALLAYGTN